MKIMMQAKLFFAMGLFLLATPAYAGRWFKKWTFRGKQNDRKDVAWLVETLASFETKPDPAAILGTYTDFSVEHYAKLPKTRLVIYKYLLRNSLVKQLGRIREFKRAFPKYDENSLSKVRREFKRAFPENFFAIQMDQKPEDNWPKTRTEQNNKKLLKQMTYTDRKVRDWIATHTQSWLRGSPFPSTESNDVDEEPSSNGASSPSGSLNMGSLAAVSKHITNHKGLCGMSRRYNKSSALPLAENRKRRGSTCMGER